jgi:transposase
MISDEVRARIRRLFFAEHWKVGTIASELGVHHDTVRGAIDADRFVSRGARVAPSMLDPYKAFVQETLLAHPRLRATRIFEMLRPRGYPGSAVQLRRYVRRVRPRSNVEAFFRRTTLPGEEAQVDWAHFGRIEIGRARRALSCFVLVLSSSRAMFARFALDQTLESFLLGHVRAFEALGGVPRAVLYDNLKTAVLDRQGDHIRFHPRLLELAGHYHFAPKPCAPYRGNEKGKVERAIHYLRYSFFEARRFSSLDDLNAQLAAWIEDVAHARIVPADPERRIVRDAWADERTRLLPLPEHSFECELVRPIASGKTPYVRFDQNDYSIPAALVRKPLTLIASERGVRIADGATTVADHVRTYDRGVTVEDPQHLVELAEQKRHARVLRRRDVLRHGCPQVDAFFAELAQRGDSLSSAATQLGRLLDEHGAAALDAAIADALHRGAVSAVSVRHLLEQRARAAKLLPRIPVALPDDPRVRELTVTPHALDTYDALSRPHPDTEEKPS